MRKWGKIFLVIIFLISVIVLPNTPEAAERENVLPNIQNSLGYPELAQFLEIATLRNANVAMAVERINQARENFKVAASKLGPDLVAGGTARVNNEVRYGRDKEETNAFLHLSQTLYTGGTLTANRHAASLALSVQIVEGTRTYQEILHNVRAAYFDCLRSRAQAQVAQEGVTLSQEHLRQAEALFRGGMAPKGDVLRVKVSLNQSELDLITAKSNFEVSWTSLEFAVGSRLEKEKSLTIAPQESIDELSPPLFDISVDFLERALEQRPEIHAYRYHIDRANSLVRAAQGQRAPTLSLSGQLNSDEDASSLSNGEWYAQLDLQWVLYDSGEISSNIRKAKATERELRAQTELIESQVTQEALAAEIRLRAAIARKELAYEQMQTSKEDYRLALRRYDAQMGTNLDVLDARRALINSRTEYVNAVYDIAVAQSGLIYAMGEDEPPVNFFRYAQR